MEKKVLTEICHQKFVWLGTFGITNNHLLHYFSFLSHWKLKVKSSVISNVRFPTMVICYYPIPVMIVCSTTFKTIAAVGSKFKIKLRVLFSPFFFKSKDENLCFFLLRWINSRAFLRGKNHAIFSLGAIHKWCHPLRRKGESTKRWRYSISLFSKMGDKGEGGVKKSQKMGDVINRRPLRSLQKLTLIIGSYLQHIIMI